jgi:hypothetical protein
MVGMRLFSPRQRLRVQRLDSVGAWIGRWDAANGMAGLEVLRMRTTPRKRKLTFGRFRAFANNGGKGGQGLRPGQRRAQDAFLL